MSDKKQWEGYSVESLHNGIRSCEVNIVTFEDAIKKERKTMTEYRWMIDQIERKKSEAIEASIVQAEVNASIALQNAAHEAKYPHLKSVQVTKEKEYGD